jgi:hypothetical protein
MPSIAVHAQSSQLVVSEADQAQMKAVRLKRRIFELISNVSDSCALAHFAGNVRFFGDEQLP